MKKGEKENPLNRDQPLKDKNMSEEKIENGNTSKKNKRTYKPLQRLPRKPLTLVMEMNRLLTHAEINKLTLK